MNPNQAPGNNPGSTSAPQSGPADGSVVDTHEEAFGFADERPQQAPMAAPAPQPAPQQTLPPVQMTQQPVQPTPPVATPQPAPRPLAQPAPRPFTQPAPRPVQQPVAQPPVAAPQPIAPPMPAPIAPQVPVQQPTPATPPAPRAPQAIMPPANVPAVPTLTAAQPPVSTPTPVPAPSPAPTPAPIPAPTPAPAPFNPPEPVAHAATAPQPVTASYTPQNVTHIPADVAARIGETPMQNSRDIMRRSKQGVGTNRLKSAFSFLAFIAAIFFAAFLINQFVFQSYYVEGTSMTPTLQNDDRLIISKVERTIANVQGKPYIPERGQIVVLDSSIVGLNGQHEQLIKRVIGLPGDKIHIEAGTIIVTNSQHPNGYDITRDLGLTNLQSTYVDAPIDITIGQGQVYVMGDNREQGGSYDSRSFGPIEGNKIQGRLWGRILPIDKAQLY